MEDLLDNGKWSDLTIKCRDRTWKVHCAIVLTRSKPLEASITHGTKEAQTGVIDLAEDEPNIVEKMLRFLYQGDYDDERRLASPCPTEVEVLSIDPDEAVEELPEPLPTVDPEAIPEPEDAIEPVALPDPDGSEVRSSAVTFNPAALTVNVKVYIIADRLDIDSLKQSATSKYTTLVSGMCDTTEFSTSADILYEWTVENSRPLREIISAAAAERAGTMMKSDEFVGVMKRRGELAVDVLKNVLQKKEADCTSYEDVDEGWPSRKSKKKGRSLFN